jgi:hydrogenase small subunit
MALGTCAAYGGIPAMRNNPTGAMGLRDYLGWNRVSRRGIPVVNLPGCPAQPDNITATLLHLVLHLVQMGPPMDLDDQGRPTAIFGRTVHEGCNRAGLVEVGQFSERHGEGQYLVKLGCKGPVGQMQRRPPRLDQRDRRLPERRRDLHGLHDAGLS